MVQGVQSFRGQIAKVLPAIEAEVRKALSKWANTIVAEMRALAAVESGALRDSIGWTWGDEPDGTEVLGVISERGLKITIHAGGKGVHWARWVEFGTQPHSLARNASVLRAQAGSVMQQKRQASGGHHPGTSAQPFFYPVWRANRPKVKQAISRAVRRGIKKARP